MLHFYTDTGFMQTSQCFWLGCHQPCKPCPPFNIGSTHIPDASMVQQIGSIKLLTNSNSHQDFKSLSMVHLVVFKLFYQVSCESNQVSCMFDQVSLSLDKFLQVLFQHCITYFFSHKVPLSCIKLHSL